MSITLDQADRAIAAAKKRADELGVHVGISVVDPKGDLVAFARHGARAFTADASRGKAMTAAMFHSPSATYGAHDSEPHPGFYAFFQNMSQHRLLFAPGGIPISSGDEELGAIGVSGGLGNDEEIAKAGAAAI
jgi:uncharacterized protein GlcG (DUF336 family)